MMYLNHSKAEIKKMKKDLKIRIVGAILKRLPERAVNNVTYEAEQLAKRHGIKSIFNKVKRKAKSAGRKVKRKAKKAKGKIRRRAKTAMSYPRSRGGTRYTNGRSFKSRRKSTQYQGKPILIAKNGQPYIKKANGRVKFISRIYA
jgi:hypothetical protein